MRELRILISLGEKGALERSISLKTTRLSKELKIPQQTVSRVLRKLTEKKLITRERGIKGYIVRITPNGKKFLQDLSIDLNEILQGTKQIIIKGRVIDGLKDGKYYMSLNEYRKAIKKKLGFDPYPGTLNIRLMNNRDREKKTILMRMDGINIESFRKGGRVFGSLKCFDCKIDGIKASILIPERSHYGSDILEIISPFELRKKMNLKNGNIISVRVEHENL